MDHAHHLSLPDEPGRRRPDGSPSAARPAPPLGLGFLGVIAAGMALLSIGQRSSAEGTGEFATTTVWVAWKFAASVSIAVFGLLFIQGVRLLRNPTQWGLAARLAYDTCRALTRVGDFPAADRGVDREPGPALIRAAARR